MSEVSEDAVAGGGIAHAMHSLKEDGFKANRSLYVEEMYRSLGISGLTLPVLLSAVDLKEEV